MTWRGKKEEGEGWVGEVGRRDRGEMTEREKVKRGRSERKTEGAESEVRERAA